MEEKVPWYIGYIPNTLRSPELDEYIIGLAELGYVTAKTYFGIELYFTQSLILGAALSPDENRIACITTTRYGKSFTLSMVAILLAGLQHKKVLIGAVDEKKTTIIMDAVAENLLKASPLLKKNLQGKNAVEKLNASISKSKLSWTDGGSIEVMSLNEKIKNSSVAGQSGVGKGGDVIILDESCLISDPNYAVAKRIILESPHVKMIEISNPHQKNHFYKAILNKSGRNFVVWMNHITAVEEGRINWDQIEELRGNDETGEDGMTKKEFKIFVECEFPDENEFSYFHPKRYKELPKIKEYYGALDLSLGEKQENFHATDARKSSKACMTAIVVLGIGEDNQLYEVESIIAPLTPDEAIKKILELPYKFRRFGIETVLFQQYIYEMARKRSLEQKKYIPFVGLRQKAKKTARIEAISDKVDTGLILFKGYNELWTEMEKYGNEKYHVDGLDTLEMAFRLIKWRRRTECKVKRNIQVQVGIEA